MVASPDPMQRRRRLSACVITCLSTEEGKTASNTSCLPAPSPPPSVTAWFNVEDVHVLFFFQMRCNLFILSVLGKIRS